MQAAILISKLSVFDIEVEARMKIGKRYTEQFKKNGFAKVPFISPTNTSVFGQYTIQVDNRDKVIENMKSKGIPTSVHYPSLLPDQEALKNLNLKNKKLFKNLFSGNSFRIYSIDNAKKIAKKVLSLPMHPLLTIDNQDLVINSLLESIN